MKNLKKTLFNKYDFQLNAINTKVYFKSKKEQVYRELNEIDLNSILNYLRKNNVQITKITLKELLYSDAIPIINPIEQYFEELPEIDGNLDYIKSLSETVKTTNQDFFERALKKWIVGMVACALNPKLTNQQALILCGKQGCGKTTWLEKLVPEKLKEYLYNGTTDPKNKDTKIAMSQYLLMNMDEMSDYNSNQVEAFKEMITKTVISERKVYATSTCNYTRICSFVGSSNTTGILIDPTGNRRFLCFNIVGDIKFNHKIDMNLVMAQAYKLYKEGFKFYFDGNEISEIEENNNNFMKTNPVLELIQSLIEVPLENVDKTVLLNATDVFILIKKKHSSFSVSPERIGREMKSLGFKERKDKRGTKKYVVKLIEK